MTAALWVTLAVAVIGVLHGPLAVVIYRKLTTRKAKT